MRVTQNMMSRTMLSDLQDVSARLAQTQQKLSSGKRITKPSDDPYGTTRALQFRAELAANQQYQRNVQEADAWQTATESALSSVNDIAQRARELLVRGASDTQDASARESIATEIDQLIEAVKTEGNAKYAGRYIFAGSATLTPPYQSGPNDTYAGNADALHSEIGPGVQLDLNVDGRSVLGDDSGGLIHTLRQVATDLRAGNTAALSGTDLGALDGQLDTVSNTVAVVGARQNRLETALSRLQDMEQSTTALLSETEDADMAKTLVDFSMQQAVYQSALKSGAQIIQPSLMDFLR
jgi:flagellar hook-associated protein 3 FlgL